MFRVQPLQESVEFHLLGRGQDRADARMNVFANRVVPGLNLVLALLEDGRESLMRAGENRVDFTLLPSSQLQFPREAIKCAFVARHMVHMPENHCAETADEAAEHK